jgi:hypothetical protein|tara:strand:- start:5133 stop:5441 length:309 start_codon:yes stop_codon:yes gene_type:complete
MPRKQQKIKITDNLNEEEIKNARQPVQKLILKSMLELGKDQKIFSYEELVKFMIDNKDNSEYYNGSGIKSINNIWRYWGYSKSEVHGSKINNFSTYYILVKN